MVVRSTTENNQLKETIKRLVKAELEKLDMPILGNGITENFQKTNIDKTS